MARQVVIPYAPRGPQGQIHEALDQARFVTCVAHRRMGKTVAAVNHLIKAAILNDQDRPRYAYVAPTYSQGKAVAWDYLKHYTRPLGATVNESELRVDFWGRQIRIYGADNPDSLRGLYFDGVVLDEIGMMRPNLWSQVVRPALADRKGWALFIGTPAGHNHFYDLAELAKTTEGWQFLEFKASVTQIVPQEELDAAKQAMTPDEYEQEFECSFEASVKGAVYAKEISDARRDNRITRVPYDPMVPVQTFWDLSVGDSTAIWFAQVVGMEIRLIDYYEASGEGLQHYANVLTGRRYNYSRHVAPHDIEVRELGTGKSRLEVAAGLGIHFEIAPQLSLEDGINTGRMVFPRCYFDAEKCKAGLECLQNYRWDYNQRINEFKPTPVHDWASHGADAFRYMAITNRKVEKPKPIQYSSRGIV